MKLLSNMNIDEDKLEDVDGMGEKEELNLNNNIANEENQHNHFDPDQHEDQKKFFGTNQDDNQDDSNVEYDDKDSVNDDMERDQAVQDNNHIIPEDYSISVSSLDSQDINGNTSNDGSDDHLDDSPQEATLRAQT